MWSHRKIPGLMKLLYTQNPFYALSAALILYGLYRVFRADDAAVEHPWRLAAALCGYTAVLAVAAVLVVRLGKVWEDARSIVLILLLQLAAISLSFDQLCSTAPATARGLLAFGFGFAVLISEGVLAGLRIRLPALFRGPYYLWLLLFFAYPLGAAPRLVHGSVSFTAWWVYLFPIVAGAVCLTLLPAVRCRGAYVAGNGTPWFWPWFPWTAFGVLAFATGVRSYVLTYNFNLMGAGDAFGTYYLVPLLLAVLIVVLELAIVGHARRLQAVLLALAPLLVVLALPLGDSDPFRRFLRTLTATVGSPVWTTALALAVFYAYAWLRRLPGAEAGLIGMLVLLTWVGRPTLDSHTLVAPQWWPWCVMGAFELVLAAVRRRTWRAALAAGSLLVAASLAGRDTPLLAWRGTLPAHLVVASWLVIGLIGRDWFARLLRRVGLAVVVAAALAALVSDSWRPAGPAVQCAYVSGLAAVAWLYWWATRDRWWLGGGLLTLAGLAAAGLRFSHRDLADRLGAEAVTPLAWGAACFVVAVLISALKGGLGASLRERFRAPRLLPGPPRERSPAE